MLSVQARSLDAGIRLKHAAGVRDVVRTPTKPQRATALTEDSINWTSTLCTCLCKWFHAILGEGGLGRLRQGKVYIVFLLTFNESFGLLHIGVRSLIPFTAVMPQSGPAPDSRFTVLLPDYDNAWNRLVDSPFLLAGYEALSRWRQGVL